MAPLTRNNDLDGVKKNLAKAEAWGMLPSERERYAARAVEIINASDFPSGLADQNVVYNVHAGTVELLESAIQSRVNRLGWSNATAPAPPLSADAPIRGMLDAIQLELRRMAKTSLQENWPERLRTSVMNLVGQTTKYPPISDVRSTEQVAIDTLLEFGFMAEARTRAKPIVEARIREGDFGGALDLAKKVDLGSMVIDPLVRRLETEHETLVTRFQVMVDSAGLDREEARRAETARLAGDEAYSDGELESLTKALEKATVALEFGKENGLTGDERFRSVEAQARVTARELCERHRSVAAQCLGEILFERKTIKAKRIVGHKTVTEYRPKSRRGDDGRPWIELIPYAVQVPVYGMVNVDVALANKVYLASSRHVKGALQIAREWTLPRVLVDALEQFRKHLESLLREQIERSGLEPYLDALTDPDPPPSPTAIERFLNYDRPGEEV